MNNQFQEMSANFNGDIIITDPCFFLKTEIKERTPYPHWWDYLSKSYVITEGQEKGTHYYPKDKDYPDAKPMTFQEFLLNSVTTNSVNQMRKIYKELKLCNKLPVLSKMLAKELKELEIAEEKWQKENETDANRFLMMGDTTVFSFDNYIVSYTFAGDWVCKTYSNNKEIGDFCADAGIVGVFYLNDVMKYNPEFKDYIENKKYAVTVIHNFKGTVKFVSDKNGNLKIIGEGNIPFETKQI